jgi:hypothetical protein
LYSIAFTAATPEKVSREYSITPRTITSANLAHKAHPQPVFVLDMAAVHVSDLNECDRQGALKPPIRA